MRPLFATAVDDTAPLLECFSPPTAIGGSRLSSFGADALAATELASPSTGLDCVPVLTRSLFITAVGDTALLLGCFSPSTALGGSRLSSFRTDARAVTELASPSAGSDCVPVLTGSLFIIAVGDTAPLLGCFSPSTAIGGSRLSSFRTDARAATELASPST